MRKRLIEVYDDLGELRATLDFVRGSQVKVIEDDGTCSHTHPATDLLETRKRKKSATDTIRNMVREIESTMHKSLFPMWNALLIKIGIQTVSQRMQFYSILDPSFGLTASRLPDTIILEINRLMATVDYTNIDGPLGDAVNREALKNITANKLKEYVNSAVAAARPTLTALPPQPDSQQYD